MHWFAARGGKPGSAISAAAICGLLTLLIAPSKSPAWQQSAAGRRPSSTASGGQLGAAQISDNSAGSANSAPVPHGDSSGSRTPPPVPGSQSGAVTIDDSNPTRPASIVGSEEPASAAARIEASTFKGIQPGTSTRQQLQQAWGEPQNVDRFETHEELTYAIEPFQKVSVAVIGDAVSTMVVSLQAPVAAEDLGVQLGLAGFEPALVYDDTGAVLGQVFPERGVLFSFVPGERQYLTSQLVLRPIHPQPFLLRAEQRLRTRYQSCLDDLQQALRLNPQYGRAYWLQAQALSAVGRHHEALEAAQAAVRLQPEHPEYRLTYAKALDQRGEAGRALQLTKDTLALPDLEPTVRARGLCQLADLVAATSRDYHQAVDLRLKAIELADPLIGSPQATRRRAAREVLIDAHARIAHDIAWGQWRRKSEVVPKWLDEALTLANEAIRTGDGSADYRFRVALQALAACVGARGQVDPASWAELARKTGNELMESDDDSLHRHQLQWDLGLAMYDALQSHHERGEAEEALACGKLAVEHFESGAAGRGDATDDAYLVGRLYFRIGAVYSIVNRDHVSAIDWFDKAIPLLKAYDQSNPTVDLGQQGESLVGMAVSYWITGDERTAVELTTEGLELMKQTVAAGKLSESALAVPYANLASMHQHLGDREAARKFDQLASRSRTQTR